MKIWSEIGDKIGNGSLIVIVNVSLSDPPELLAYNVYVTAVVWLTEGVPDMTPFVMLRPAGSDGEISQLATLPPVFVATTSVIVTPLV